MDKQEIKLELAKAAIQSGSSIEVVKEFYEWIMSEKGESEIDLEEYDNIPIESFALYFERSGNAINRFRSVGLNSVGDLVRFGKYELMRVDFVGKKFITEVIDLLEEHYGSEVLKIFEKKRLENTKY